MRTERVERTAASWAALAGVGATGVVLVSAMVARRIFGGEKSTYLAIGAPLAVGCSSLTATAVYVLKRKGVEAPEEEKVVTLPAEEEFPGPRRRKGARRRLSFSDCHQPSDGSLEE